MCRSLVSSVRDETPSSFISSSSFLFRTGFRNDQARRKSSNAKDAVYGPSCGLEFSSSAVLSNPEYAGCVVVIKWINCAKIMSTHDWMVTGQFRSSHLSG